MNNNDARIRTLADSGEDTLTLPSLWDNYCFENPTSHSESERSFHLGTENDLVYSSIRTPLSEDFLNVLDVSNTCSTRMS